MPYCWPFTGSGIEALCPSHPGGPSAMPSVGVAGGWSPRLYRTSLWSMSGTSGPCQIGSRYDTCICVWSLTTFGSAGGGGGVVSRSAAAVAVALLAYDMTPTPSAVEALTASNTAKL